MTLKFLMKLSTLLNLFHIRVQFVIRMKNLTLSPCAPPLRNAPPAPGDGGPQCGAG